jgi:hypothetical protein
MENEPVLRAIFNKVWVRAFKTCSWLSMPTDWAQFGWERS